MPDASREQGQQPEP